MAKVTELDVQLIAATEFHAPQGVEWEVDPGASASEALVEFAGRACYESFDKPNPRTASNQAYLHHILEVGHDALLEHATATLYIRGLSRSATHELVRHRHFSFSQLSQRFVHPEETEVVLPKLIAEDEQLTRLTLQAADDARFVYEELLNALESKLEEEPNALLRKSRRARPPAPCCPTSPNLALSSPVTIARGVTSSARAPRSRRIRRCGSWR